MTTTTPVHLEPGTTFWLMMAALTGVLRLWSVLGSERMARVIGGASETGFVGSYRFRALTNSCSPAAGVLREPGRHVPENVAGIVSF